MSNTVKKMAVFDLDGTLLNDRRVLSEENKEALYALNKAGYEVVLASGRPEILMRVYYLSLPFVRYVISANGGLVRDIRQDASIYQRAIKQESVHKIISICDNKKAECDLYSFEAMRNFSTTELDKEITDEIMFDFRHRILKDRSFSEYPCEKMFLLEENPVKLAQLRQNIEEEVRDVEITQSSFQALDVMARGVNKGSAVEWLADKLQISPTDIVAFGDHLNDREMLSFAGVSVVCSNAVEEIKKIATHVLEKSNHENGIAFAVQTILLKND